jgi:mono/diheme cytochrome c family protein
MNSRIIRISLFFVVTSIVISVSAFNPNQDKPWVVPEKYVKMANPVNSDAASLKEGKELWARNCQSCHGKTGMGDGLKANQSKSSLVDLSTDLVQKQTNGALFFKISEGRSNMPSFKNKLESEQDIWNLINYLRTLRK